jgi:hypothetical protein
VVLQGHLLGPKNWCAWQLLSGSICLLRQCSAQPQPDKYWLHLVERIILEGKSPITLLVLQLPSFRGGGFSCPSPARLAVQRSRPLLQAHLKRSMDA